MKYIIYSINIILVFFMLYRTIEFNDDKSILIIEVYYPILLFINLLIAGVLKLLRNNNYRIFIYSSLILLFLLIPVFVICKKYNLIG
jgi:hypothetical protein